MMNTPKINTSQKVMPMIYAYATPEVERHNGWTKIGYTEQQSVEERIKQQAHTINVKTQLLWKGNAVYEDGSGETFTDADFHAYLKKKKVQREAATEWFHIDGNTSRNMFYDFKSNRGLIRPMEVVIPYKLRDEQAEAVQRAFDYQKLHHKGEFLWNAKPRFGKTLSVYDLAKRMKAVNVLIVTNRPAIANSWFSDYARFLGLESGYLFVSEVDSLQGKDGVFSRKEYAQAVTRFDAEGCIEFVSMQNMKGSQYFGGKFDKLKYLTEIDWDLLVIDEAHEGVDTLKTEIAFDKIKRRFTLHLSGTPFKALANNKFEQDAIFNWTYAEEQDRKHNWNEAEKQEPNPYANLPQLNMFTYKMSDIVQEKLANVASEEFDNYAFDLNEFFAVNNGRFIYEDSVDKFLDALTLQKKFPFSTPELRDELKHTLWLLNRVESAKALAKKLKEHPVFKDYEVVLAAGEGKIDENDLAEDSYNKTVKAIAENDKTITLSVGQLTTGITIPEWTAVLMLSNIKSPALYMQAAFRSQNPCLFHNGTSYFRKENAYVFDFDPARTLTIFEQFANDLYSDTTSGHGDTETRKERVRQLLNFFPVIGEDENGELTELDAEKVLTVPRKIRSEEVVRRGFMSNFLFQNIDRIFGAPKEVMDIIQKFEPVKAPKDNSVITVPEDLEVDENGDPVVSREQVIGLATELFGEKVFSDIQDIQDVVDTVKEDADDKAIRKFADELKKQVARQTEEKVSQAVEAFEDVKKSDGKKISSELNRKSEKIIETSIVNRKIEQNKIEKERTEELQKRHETGRSVKEIEAEYHEKQKEADQKFKQELTQKLSEFVDNSGDKIVETLETNRKEKEMSTVEDQVRDRLRGFSRTIPSFLMAYGDETVTLATFDRVIPDAVFQEVTGITLAQFCFLRDGGPYKDEKTGEEKMFRGQLFDPIVFDDSVKEFLNKRKQLANYFDENQKEDIFDYVPPQKTNQIFTPKWVVKKMVDLLEEENPGCFDDPDKTYIDLYMKSGLYIAEIVKRLYNNPRMKELFPKRDDRLRHIFEKQVYGLAPTEIIYRIARNFILGFSEETEITKDNLRQVDALPYAKAGTLSKMLDKLY